jgi:hypothetical protein
MAQEKSFNSRTPVSVGKMMRRSFGVSIPATAALSVVFAVVFAIAIDGCSGNNKKTNTSGSSASSSIPTKGGSSLPATGLSEPKNKSVIAKKAPRPSTVTYTDSVSGVSFRYPRQYSLMTSEKAALNSGLLDRVPMNFVQPGGVKLATIAAADAPATPLLGINVHRGLTAQQCEQFADPSPAEVSKNLPLDPTDDSLPLKLKVHDIDFTRVDNGTEQTDTRYYHHFENGNCYEVVLAVVEKSGSTVAVDHTSQFDKLERILTTVTIKPETPAPVTASIPKTVSDSKQ